MLNWFQLVMATATGHMYKQVSFTWMRTIETFSRYLSASVAGHETFIRKTQKRKKNESPELSHQNFNRFEPRKTPVLYQKLDTASRRDETRRYVEL